MNFGGHLTQEEIALLHQSGVGGEELQKAMEHISVCPNCAQAYAESFTPQMLQRAPRGFVEAINRRIARKKREFALYSVRVALATCATLVIVLWGSVYLKPVEPLPSPKLDFVNQINEKLYQVSNQMLEGGLLHELHETEK